MGGEQELIRIDDEELERAIHIALAVTRDMYLRFVTKDERKFHRGRAKDVIAYSVMRQLSHYQFYRKANAFELAEGRLGILPLFPDQEEGSGSSSSG
jgi:hypothetical protein